MIACTTTETDPSAVSWGDMLFGKRLDNYLATQKKTFFKLQAEANNLEKRLFIQENRLKELEQDIIVFKAQSAELHAENSNLETDVLKQKQRLQVAFNRVKNLRSEEKTLTSELAQLNDKQLVINRMLAQKEQVDILNSEVEILERAIDRVLLIRAQHALSVE